MSRMLVRAFQRADDVFEYCLILGARRIVRSWRAASVLVLISVAAWTGWTPPAPVTPAPFTSGALPVLELPDPDPLVLPAELDLIDEELALWDDQLDIDREPSDLPDLKLSFDVGIATTFEVIAVERTPAGERARILYNGSTLEVREGTIVPSIDAPALVITDIGAERILALDVWTHRILDREIPPEAQESQPVKLIAIAGEGRDLVAVVEFDRETYIVQPGSRVPDTTHPRLVVAEIFGDRLMYTIGTTGEIRVTHLEDHTFPSPDLPRLPLPDIEEIDNIDIPDIEP